MKGVKITIDLSKKIREVYIIERVVDGYLVVEEKENVLKKIKMFYVHDMHIIKTG